MDLELVLGITNQHQLGDTHIAQHQLSDSDMEPRSTPTGVDPPKSTPTGVEPRFFASLVTRLTRGGRKNLGVHLSWFSGFRWSQGLAGWFGGGVTAGTRGVTGGKMGESAKEANVDTVGVT